jgi:hypothetical protein
MITPSRESTRFRCVKARRTGNGRQITCPFGRRRSGDAGERGAA